ncbi:hypothetical protein SK128_021091 [Halocaridina rubra]|uniref:lysozyme n=1 Tax=Halocaridina rubra TaxID=373956 RepID=A0AAN9AH95_HALRR
MSSRGFSFILLLSTALQLLFSTQVSAKVYSKCGLAQELENVYRLPRSEIKNWVCIAEFESSFNTQAINTHTVDGSTDYGIFQINNRYWCKDSYGGSNGCRVDCSALLSNSISASLTCARKIEREQGLSAWVAYVQRCQNRDLNQYMAECWGRGEF